MEKIKFVVLLLSLALLVSGCVQPPENPDANCGNGTCDVTETSDSCPSDCPLPPMPSGTGDGGQLPSLPF